MAALQCEYWIHIQFKKNIELYPLRANCTVGELHLNKDVLKVSENLIDYNEKDSFKNILVVTYGYSGRGRR